MGSFFFQLRIGEGERQNGSRYFLQREAQSPVCFRRKKNRERRFCCTRELLLLQKGTFILLSKEAASCLKSRGLPKAFLTRELLTGWWEERYFGKGPSIGHCSKTSCEPGISWLKKQWLKITRFPACRNSMFLILLTPLIYNLVLFFLNFVIPPNWCLLQETHIFDIHITSPNIFLESFLGLHALAQTFSLAMPS